MSHGGWGNTARLRKIVGWVERQRYPTNLVKRWVSLPQPNLLLLKAYPSSIGGWGNSDRLNPDYSLDELRN
ncbi:MAG: hypothetical protein RID09_21805 [Coleofasciculus sp. G1-WW12-02]|uniref:hypothetical protein n=1 Tax=Coleofasciculus sp. G1-WW12-02 TaxID=3068483 RepID=UPI003301A7D2